MISPSYAQSEFFSILFVLSYNLITQRYLNFLCYFSYQFNIVACSDMKSCGLYRCSQVDVAACFNKHPRKVFTILSHSCMKWSPSITCYKIYFTAWKIKHHSCNFAFCSFSTNLANDGPSQNVQDVLFSSIL